MSKSVVFTRDFDYPVPGKFGVTVAYKAGLEKSVPDAHAAAAIGSGAATEVADKRVSSVSKASDPGKA